MDWLEPALRNETYGWIALAMLQAIYSVNARTF